MTEAAGRFVVFEGAARLSQGDRAQASKAAQSALDAGRGQPVLMFDSETGRVVDLDPRPEETVIEEAAPAKRGRPKLGVVAREVTLLPRHWDWLAQQPGGASVSLRRLVEAARKDGAGVDQQRENRDAAYRFMQAVAGDLAGFEEASRALFAEDHARLALQMASWPADIRDQTLNFLGRGAAQ